MAVNRMRAGRRPRAVFLDVGWTLIHPRRSIWEIFSDVARDEGFDLSPRRAEELVHPMMTGSRGSVIAELEGGKLYSDSDEEFAAQFTALSALVLGALGMRGDPEGWTERFLERFWTSESWQLFPDVVGGIERLRSAGIRVGVLSNAASHLVEFLDYLGLSQHLDFTVVSALEGVKKPDRRIFECALERAGVEPHEAVHVGDMYVEDVLGAGRVGVRALLMERGERSMFPGYPESATLPPGTCEIVRDMTEVLRAVGLRE